MNALELVLITARAMLSEAFEGMENARKTVNPSYPVWNGKFLQAKKFVNYIENLIEQEKAGGITFAEALALLKREG